MKQFDLKDIAIKNAEFCVVDVETTGMSSHVNRIIEIAIVKVKNFRIKETFTALVNPGVNVPYFITNLTGISTTDVIDRPPFEFYLPEICDFIGEAIVVAHNLPFDESFMKQEFLRCSHDYLPNPSMCTLRLARKMYPELKSRSLSALTRFFNIRHRDVHRALGDATVTAKLLIKMLDKMMNEHEAETAADVVNFGKLPATGSGVKFIKKKLAEDMQGLPDTPGVYFFYNAQNEIIYIGKAKSLRKRVKNYFQSNPADKPKRIVRKASRFGYEKCNSELTALLMEAELIKQHKPVMNTLLKKYSLNHFIKIDMEQDFPALKPTGSFDFDGCDYFGPYNNRETAHKLLEIVNSSYSLRECKEKEFKKGKRCYLADIDRCLAPCSGELTPEGYRDEMNRVYEFLSGRHQDAVNRLLNKMKQFAETQKYEEAAKYRDVVQLILGQLNRSSILAEPINSANALIRVRGAAHDYLLLLSGRVFSRGPRKGMAELFDSAISDYYAGTQYLFNGVDKKDLEQTKIILSWLVKNRTRADIYYLKDYASLDELYAKASLRE